MRKFAGKLLVVAVVFLTPLYVSSCASKPKPQAENAPLSEEEQARQEKLKEQAATEEKIKSEEMERKRALEEQKLVKEREAEAVSPEFIEKLEMVHFDFDKSEIKPQDRAILEKNAEIIKAHPTVHVVIEGHCDERGTDEYNLALGERRANSARDFLVNLGADASQLSTVSMGLEKPIDPGHNEAAWSKNRRAQFLQK